jgi:uncharacterized membrane protein YbhN (UPF0104 family)
MRFEIKTIISIILFLFLCAMSMACVILGFALISIADTTIIDSMQIMDWILCITGAMFVFSSFIFVNLLGKVRRFIYGI